MNGTNSAAHRLYQRFYRNTGAVVETSASSHWRECARHFKVNPVGQNDFELTGYGFGTSAYSSLAACLTARAGIAIHLTCLGMPGLRRDVRRAKKIVHRMGLMFSQDAFRQVCTLNLLVRQMEKTQAPDSILIIGDGHGILSALIHARYPDARLFLIDLGSVLFFQAYLLHRAFPEAPQAITDENTEGHSTHVFNFCPAESHDTLPQGELNLAINVASMQEMDPEVISRYFALIRQRKTRLFYCCNRLEKHLEGGEITRFMDYPWSKGDEHLVDEPCPWHQWFFGLGSSPNLKLFGFPVPFIHRFDGTHWHRLTQIKGEFRQ